METVDRSGASHCVDLPQSALERLVQSVHSCRHVPFSADSLETAFYHQAYRALEAGELSAALQSLRSCLHESSTFAPAHLLFALYWSEVWAVTKEPAALAAALESYQCAINLDSSLADAYFHLGVLCDTAGIAGAQSLWLEAVSLDPSMKDAYLKLAATLVFREGRYEEGVACFNRCLEIDPDYLEAWSKTNFYEVYLKGVRPRALEEHEAKRLSHCAAMRKAHQLDALNVRFLTGITFAIGHYFYLDLHAKAEILGHIPYRSMVLSEPGEIVNPALLSYFQPYIPTISDPLAVRTLKPLVKYLEATNTEILGWQEKWGGNYYRFMESIYAEWEEQQRPPLIQLTEEHTERGWKALSAFGMRRGDWFVAVHVRDDGYKGIDTDHALRNADIQTYREAFQEITGRGGWVVRMGDAKMAPAPEMPRVIDYARSPLKSDWLDVFLWSQARFFMGGNSGPSWIPGCFHVPVLRVNWAPITRAPMSHRDLLVPKLIKERDSGRMLSFGEIIDPDGRVGWTHSSNALAERELVPLDNTPEDLKAAVVEMLEGKAPFSREEEELQQRYLDLAREVSRGKDQGASSNRLARSFLLAHRDLIK